MRWLPLLPSRALDIARSLRRGGITIGLNYCHRTIHVTALVAHCCAVVVLDRRLMGAASSVSPRYRLYYLQILPM